MEWLLIVSVTANAFLLGYIKQLNWELDGLKCANRNLNVELKYWQSCVLSLRRKGY